MTRVSLTEDYDDRSVISKLNEMDKRIKENASVVTAAEESAKASAESAQETADRFAGSVGAVVQNANAQINASKAQVDSAKAEVDETVSTVAQAVQTANNASASAQQSATTVAGYETRLSSAENTIQGQGTEIQHLGIETRDLYDRDANNVKLDGDQTIYGVKKFSGELRSDYFVKLIGKDNEHSVKYTPSATYYAYPFVDRGSDELDYLTCFRYQTDYGSTGLCIDVNNVNEEGGLITTKRVEISHDRQGNGYFIVPDVPSGAPSNNVVTKAYVEAMDGVTNNLVHRTADETINGIKTFETVGLKNTGAQCHNLVVISGNDRYWVVNLTNPNNTILAQLQMVNYANGTVGIDLSKVNTATGVTETRNIVRF